MRTFHCTADIPYGLLTPYEMEKFTKKVVAINLEGHSAEANGSFSSLTIDLYGEEMAEGCGLVRFA